MRQRIRPVIGVFDLTSMTFKSAAHEHIQAMLFAVKNDGEWNVHVPPKVDVKHPPRGE